MCDDRALFIENKNTQTKSASIPVQKIIDIDHTPDRNYWAVLDQKQIFFIHFVDQKPYMQQVALGEFSTDTFKGVLALSDGTIATWSELGIQLWDPRTAKNIARMGVPGVYDVIEKSPHTLLASMKKGGISCFNITTKKQVGFLPGSIKNGMFLSLSDQTVLRVSNKKKQTFTEYRLEQAALEAVQKMSDDKRTELQGFIKVCRVGAALEKEQAAYVASLPKALQECLHSNFSFTGGKS